MSLFGRRTKPKPVTPAVLKPGVLPVWLALYFLQRTLPQPGTPEAAALRELVPERDPEGDYRPAERLSRIRALWLEHRETLMESWAAEKQKGKPWGCVFDREPGEDPRDLLDPKHEKLARSKHKGGARGRP